MPDAADEFIAKIRARGGDTAVEKDPIVDDFIAKVRVRRGDPVGMGEVRAAMFGDAGTEAALPLSEDDKAAYIKRLFPGQDYDPGSEVLSPEEQQRIFADYKREPYVVGAGGADPEFTRRTSVAAFDKLLGPRTVGDRQQIEEILAKHEPKEASAGERAQYLGGQFMEGMNAPAMGYARRLFGRGGALENPASLEAAENVANPSRKSIGDGRFEEVRKDVESTFVGRTLSGAANLAGATPGLLATGAALTKPTVLGVANPLAKVVPPMAAGPTALGLNALASSGGDVAAAGEGVAFGAIAGALSIPLKQYIASLPIALQSKAVDRLATMAAGGLEFAAADAILHGPDGERALTNFIFGAGMKAVGTSPGQARARELTTSRATYPDPVEAARGVRGGYDRRLAEVESARPATPALEPVAEAKATAAEFDARPTPEPTAPEKPVSVAPVAPDAPASKTLVGTDKRGREVWEVRGKFYVRDTGGRLGTAHPQEVAEAKASAQTPAPEPARLTDLTSPEAKTGNASVEPPVEARPMEAPPKPADVVRELTAPPAETSMFAGGPESISTKAYEAWTATREGFRGAIKGLKDFFSSQKAPELLRLSPRAWRGVVAAESAPQIAKAAVKVWEAEVPNPSWSPKERVQFEAALTENNRLGAVDNRIADAEAKRTEAQALREQAATLNGSAAADALLKKATRLDREALVFDERAKRAEGKNEYLIGEGKPFASQAELAEFVSRPDVVEAAKRHQAWWSEMVEPSYKSAQSIEGTEPMPTRGRFFDSRASLVVPPEGEAATGVAGTKAGQTENIKTRRSKFAHLAWGDSSRGYEVEANKYLKKALEDVVPKGGWRDAVDSLVREGHGVRLTKPDQKPPTEIAGEPAMKFDIGQQGERVYLPKSLHEALTHIRQVGAATHIKGFSDLAKTATHQAMSMAKDNIFVTARAISRVMTLPSTGRPALEIAGNVALWPVMRVIDIAKLTTKALGYMRASPRERLEMARAGVAEREPMLKRDSKGRVETDAQGNPIEVDANLPGLKWLGPVSNAIDTAARESLVTTMRRLKANGVNIDTSPAAMSKYVGQLGRYGRAWYGAVQRFFTDAGINPFFESRRTSRGNALRTMAANPNLTPLDTGTALKLRGVVLSKLVGLMTTTAIANVLTTGDALGGPSTPIGAISLGKDKDGKRIFLDFWKLMGIRQVARATGIEQALEGLRRGDDAGQVALSALTGAGREAAGFASGPLPTALSIGATGSRPDQLIGGQKDASIPAAVDPATLTRRRAVEGAKAALPLVGEGAELFAKWFGGENIKDILNAGTEVTPDMIDEFVNLRNTVGVGVGQTDAQASTLHDRSNKGFFFGTYLDAVKEDLRRASPDKVQAIVDKAWRDIDTRDDLSAGDKKKAKSAIQYYARNRRLLMGGK